MTTSRDATSDDAGRICPFCRFPLKSGAAVLSCQSCSALHHTECWEENRGCAVLGCASAPGAETAAWAATPAPAPAPTATPPAGPPPSSPPRRSSALIAAALVLLAFAIGGVAVALVITRQEQAATAGTPDPKPDLPAATETPTETPTEAPTPKPTLAPTRTPRPDPTRTPPPPEPTPGGDLGNTDAQDEIQAVISTYYDHVMNGDYRKAWRLLTPNYKEWKAAGNGGYDQWVAQERVHRERLNPSGMRLEIQGIDGDIATVMVTGMSYYRSAGDPNCNFRGVTWAKQVGGRWLYDQGYLQNAARSARWRPVRQQTLGYRCEM